MVEMKLGVNAASKHADESIQLLTSLMSDSIQFKLAYEYALGPTNRKTLKTLNLLPQAGQILVFVPTYKKNRTQAIWLDYSWHKTLDKLISERFKQWRAED